jgi:hypothetical protein
VGRDFVVSIGPRDSPETGEHAIALVLTTRSRSPCVIEGYPAVRLNDRGRDLGFTYSHGGGPYVTTARPGRVVVSQSRRGYVLIAKYRCDGAVLHSPTSVVIRLPGARAWVTVQVARSGVGDLAYCRRYPGDERVDPGNRVFVSPAEPSLQAAISQPAR